MRLSLSLLFYHKINHNNLFFGDENQYVFFVNGMSWKLNISTVWDADANGQEAQMK